MTADEIFHNSVRFAGIPAQFAKPLEEPQVTGGRRLAHRAQCVLGYVLGGDLESPADMDLASRGCSGDKGISKLSMSLAAKASLS